VKYIKPTIIKVGLAASLAVSSMLVVNTSTAGAETKISCQDRLRSIRSDFRLGFSYWSDGQSLIRFELYDMASTYFDNAHFLLQRANNALESYNEDCG
jgi:hypothetical protein